MKKWFSVFAGFMILTPVWAEAIVLDSQITNVTVYPQSAMVTRVAKTALPVGEQEVLLYPLPGQIVEKSIQASGKGPNGTKILEIRLEKKYVEEIQNENLQILRDKIRDLEKQAQLIDDSIATLRSEQQFTKTIRAASLDETGKELRIGHPLLQEWGYQLDYLRKMQEETGRELIAKEFESIELKKEIEILKQRQETTEPQQSDQSAGVIVKLKLQNPGECQIHINYMVPDASWNCSYDARVHPSGEELNLEGYALILQKTGEDWNDAAIRLSTSSQEQGMFMIKPQTLYTHTGDNLSSTDSASSYSFGRTMGGIIKGKKIQQVPAEALEEGFQMVFDIPGKQKILSSGTEHRIFFNSWKMKGFHRNICAPIQSDVVYQIFRAANDTDIPVFSGNVKVFSGDSFLGECAIDRVNAGEKFDLAMGTDKNVRVERKEFDRKDGTSTFEKSAIQTFNYEITVQNFHQKDSGIEILDRIPVSTDSKITVKRLPFSMEPIEDTDGILKWFSNLKPGQKTVISFGYEITYPNGENLIYLPKHN